MTSLESMYGTYRDLDRIIHQTHHSLTRFTIFNKVS
jgi:hypothetical protein